MNKEHTLKTWSQYFDRIETGQKLFEVRKNDRDFQVGDILRLEEWNPETKEYSHRVIHVEVTYVLQGGQFGIDPGFCVMSITNPI